MLVGGLGCPIGFVLTPGQAGDAPQAGPLIEGRQGAVVIADTAYDSDALRNQIKTAGATAVIPNNSTRKNIQPFDKELYKTRHLIECCFAKLKHFRRVSTRYEKTARNYAAIVTIAATILWLR